MTLDTILATTVKQPQCFSRALNQELYEANPTCGQNIANLEDAAVDDIEMYWFAAKRSPKTPG